MLIMSQYEDIYSSKRVVVFLEGGGGAGEGNLLNLQNSLDLLNPQLYRLLTPSMNKGHLSSSDVHVNSILYSCKH